MHYLVIIVLFLLVSCSQKKQQETVVTPWGEIADTIPVDDDFDLEDIQRNGELIALTLTGPDTYYDYHGRHLGAQYLLCQRFADKLGVSLRMEVCRDTSEMLRRLGDGEADLICYPMRKGGPGWIVGADKEDLQMELDQWYQPSMLAEVKQESTFDPQARSWAGACGLMQIMPGTADHLGLARSDIFDPEKNIAAAVRYIAELEQAFSDIRVPSERTKFVLAAYNGGSFHIRDAMALARKNGRNATLWRDVEPFVLGLSRPEYYNDGVVKNGYMRGSETVDYVRRILERWDGYRGVRAPRSSTPTLNGVPQKAKHERKKKYQITE